MDYTWQSHKIFKADSKLDILHTYQFGVETPEKKYKYTYEQPKGHVIFQEVTWYSSSADSAKMQKEKSEEKHSQEWFEFVRKRSLGNSHRTIRARQQPQENIAGDVSIEKHDEETYKAYIERNLGKEDHTYKMFSRRKWEESEAEVVASRHLQPEEDVEEESDPELPPATPDSCFPTNDPQGETSFQEGASREPEPCMSFPYLQQEHMPEAAYYNTTMTNPYFPCMGSPPETSINYSNLIYPPQPLMEYPVERPELVNHNERTSYDRSRSRRRRRRSREPKDPDVNDNSLDFSAFHSAKRKTQPEPCIQLPPVKIKTEPLDDYESVTIKKEPEDCEEMENIAVKKEPVNLTEYEDQAEALESDPVAFLRFSADSSLYSGVYGDLAPNPFM